MKVDCEIIEQMHLDPGYALLSAQNSIVCLEMFRMMDIHQGETLNDVQFAYFLANITNLTPKELQVVFNLLDVDHSGEIEFDEFYLFFCILIANKDSYEKEFIYRHSSTIFELIDADNSNQINSDEFKQMGVLFNFDQRAIKRIFKEFDISGDQNLNFAEFRLFTMACIDEARAAEARTEVKAYADYHKRLVTSMEPSLRRYIATDVLPVPREMEDIVHHVRNPYIPGKKHFFKTNSATDSIQSYLNDMLNGLIHWYQNLFGKHPACMKCTRIMCCNYCCMKTDATGAQTKSKGKDNVKPKRKCCPCCCNEEEDLHFRKENIVRHRQKKLLPNESRVKIDNEHFEGNHELAVLIRPNENEGVTQRKRCIIL